MSWFIAQRNGSQRINGSKWITIDANPFGSGKRGKPRKADLFVMVIAATKEANVFLGCCVTARALAREQIPEEAGNGWLIYRREQRAAQKVPEATATQIADRIRRWLVANT